MKTIKNIFAVLVLLSVFNFAFASTARAGTCAVYGRLWNQTVTDGAGGFAIDAYNYSTGDVTHSTVTAIGTGYYFMYLDSGADYALYVRRLPDYEFRKYPDTSSEAYVVTCQENYWYLRDFVIIEQP